MAQNSGSKRPATSTTLIIGLVLIGLGIFLVFQNCTVYTTWYTWRIGSFAIPTGVTVLPFLIGLGLLFYNPRWIVTWVVLIASALFLLLTLLFSVHIRFVQTSLLQYILMFGSIAGGLGLTLRAIFIRAKS